MITDNNDLYFLELYSSYLIYHTMPPLRTTYIALDRREAFVNTGEKFSWIVDKTELSLGNIKNIHSIRIWDFGLANGVFADAPLISNLPLPITVLIEEFLAQSFVASGSSAAQRYHFISAKPIIIKDMDVLTDDEPDDVYLYPFQSGGKYLDPPYYKNGNDGIFTFDPPIREMPNTLTLSFGNFLSRLTLNPDRLPVQSLSYNTDDPLDPYMEVVATGATYTGQSVCRFYYLASDNAADDAAIAYFNRERGFNSVDLTRVLPFNYDDPASSFLTSNLTGNISSGEIWFKAYSFRIELEIQHE